MARLRRLVPEPPVPGLRLRAALRRRARTMRAQLDADGKLEEAPDSPLGKRRRGAGVQFGRRPGHARRLVGQHLAAALPAQRHSAGRRAARRARRSGRHGVMGRRCRRRPRTTIGDTLSDQGISWAWYAGGWNRRARRRPAAARPSKRNDHLQRAATARRTSSRTTSPSTTTRASRPARADRARAPEGRRRLHGRASPRARCRR